MRYLPGAILLVSHALQVPPSRCVMLASAVSSKLLASMAAVEGFRFVETLTGFKWLGSTALELERSQEQGGEGLVALFAFEEAIGFMLGGMFKVRRRQGSRVSVGWGLKAGRGCNRSAEGDEGLR